MALWGVVGAGLGAIVRSHVVVVAGGLLWMLMLENLGAGLLEGAGRYLPGQAVRAMARTREAIGTPPPGPAAALVSAYEALFIVVALAVIRRRDIA